jgi:ketosteroid isomerase-like protein
MSVTAEEEVLRTMAAIQATWREKRPREMKPYLHPDFTLAAPGFGAMVKGRDLLIGGFVQFSDIAQVLEYRESDLDVQVIGETAVVTFRFDMTYQRQNHPREHSTGRDLWFFSRQDGQWVAVWRTMLDVVDEVVH